MHGILGAETGRIVDPKVLQRGDRNSIMELVFRPLDCIYLAAGFDFFCVRTCRVSLAILFLQLCIRHKLGDLDAHHPVSRGDQSKLHFGQRSKYRFVVFRIVNCEAEFLQAVNHFIAHVWATAHVCSFQDQWSRPTSPASDHRGIWCGKSSLTQESPPQLSADCVSSIRDMSTAPRATRLRGTNVPAQFWSSPMLRATVLLSALANGNLLKTAEFSIRNPCTLTMGWRRRPELVRTHIASCIRLHQAEVPTLAKAPELPMARRLESNSANSIRRSNRANDSCMCHTAT